MFIEGMKHKGAKTPGSIHSLGEKKNHSCRATVGRGRRETAQAEAPLAASWGVALSFWVWGPVEEEEWTRSLQRQFGTSYVKPQATVFPWSRQIECSTAKGQALRVSCVVGCTLL